MTYWAQLSRRCAVALLAEGVDRNYSDGRREAYKERSPSSRRAWIEIQKTTTKTVIKSVALLAEGVDRNAGGQLDPV